MRRVYKYDTVLLSNTDMTNTNQTGEPGLEELASVHMMMDDDDGKYRLDQLRATVERDTRLATTLFWCGCFLPILVHIVNTVLYFTRYRTNRSAFDRSASASGRYKLQPQNSCCCSAAVYGPLSLAMVVLYVIFGCFYLAA